MKQLLMPLLLLAAVAASAQKAPSQPENLVQYAHPVVGTQKMGHTYPGATVPFGIVQLSPDTDTLSYEQNGKYNPDIYKYCAGYNYDDKTIVGFSHTHFSGTGHSDLGDFLLMPTTGPLQLNPGTADRPQSGYHSTSVVADAVLNGTVAPAQAERALAACVATARHRWYDGLAEYIDRGYVPNERSGTSVSTTLEYAYDDWCIAQLARKLGHADPYQEFSKRATNWQNVFAPRANAMRPRLADGSFRPQFDVLSTNGQGFIEGNAWNYTLAVPHDPAGLIARMGGNRRFVPHLDSLFTMPPCPTRSSPKPRTSPARASSGATCTATSPPTTPPTSTTTPTSPGKRRPRSATSSPASTTPPPTASAATTTAAR
jgi:putative alpha-1,2-mannosidase